MILVSLGVNKNGEVIFPCHTVFFYNSALPFNRDTKYRNAAATPLPEAGPICTIPLEYRNIYAVYLVLPTAVDRWRPARKKKHIGLPGVISWEAPS